ncbi:MAG: methionine--tRNA ligase [Planctomycetota bacterium]|jgi:methionyl-tRNA synthetase
MANNKRYLVTSALPYANGPIHFGHVAGAYLPADIFCRYKRLTGAEVLYICGTDEHGAPILINAEKEGVDPRSYADRWHRVIRESFRRFGIDFDNFSRTSLPAHYELTQRFFKKLLDHGYILDKTEDQLFCEHCQRGLPDRYVTGTCNKCGHPDARGDECPKCGAALEALELGSPRCRTCGRDASRKPSRHWYLDLPKLYEDKLGAWLDRKVTQWRPNVSGEVRKFIQGLRPRCITRDLTWGVPVPLEDAGDKVFYVWFDAPIGYISSTIEWAENQGLPEDTWKRWWQSEDTQLVHFIGKDNIAFHTVIFPGMLLGQDEPYALPDVPANEFLNLEGRKFNTSSGWFISIDEFIDKYPRDTVRWSLTRGAPESRDAEFTYKDFQTRVNTELLGTFGNYASRLLKFVRSRYGGVIPAAAAPEGEPELKALAALRTGVADVGAALDRASTRQAATALLEVGYAANKLFEETQPFKSIKTEPDRAATSVNVAARLLEGLATLLYPFVPDTAEAMFAQLGLAGSPKDRTWASAGEPADPAGRAIGKLDHLFQRIEDKTVEAEVQALQARAAANQPSPAKEKTMSDAPATEKAPEASAEAPAEVDKPAGKAEINYDQFMAMDLRVAKVLSAEPVPKTDKLLKLELEVEGGEICTVLSGIRLWYEPESLVGRQVVYLKNLKPRKIRGVVSQGMVLAANGPDGSAILLQPDQEAPIGNPVS